MNTHNLTDESLYPMVHFYAMNRLVNIFTSEHIVKGDILFDFNKRVEVVEIEREKVSVDLELKYSYRTRFNVIKYKEVA